VVVGKEAVPATGVEAALNEVGVHSRRVGVRTKDGGSVFLLVGTAAVGWRTVRSGQGQG
jgi:hypothetical protein